MTQEEKIRILEEEVKKIKARNKKVESDKAWETSSIRKILIAAITYIFAVIFMYLIGVNSPFLNALIPVLGFLLSSVTYGFVKTWWLKNR